MAKNVSPLAISSALIVIVLGSARWASATEWIVAPGGRGPGTANAPFGLIQDALNAAKPGDIITVRPGTYAESLRTVRSGTASARIVLRSAEGRGSVLLTVRSWVLRVDHAYFTVDGLVLDGQYGDADLVQVNDGANYLVLRNSELRRTTRDCVDMESPTGVLIEGCLIHHALNSKNGRMDAHGIAAGAVHDLTVRDTEVHTFSGDGFQVDPSRRSPGWNNVTIDRCRFWLAPLSSPENGFRAGVVPGENAVDTKTPPFGPRAVMTIRDTLAWGFRGGLIANMSAFNLKEDVDISVDRVTVWDSQIAFRLRGPTSSAPAGAWVMLKNAVIHDVQMAVRYENNLENFRLWNTTIGRNVARPFVEAESRGSVIDAKNVLLQSTTLPPEAAGPGSLTVGSNSFVNAAANDYHLVSTSPAVNYGVAVAAVPTDRDGLARPQGAVFDAGAYELASGGGSGGAPPPPSDTNLYAARATAHFGAWQTVQDPTAAGGSRLSHPDAGAPRVYPKANPTNYFELQFEAVAGRPYHLWVRLKADRNLPQNDSVWVQFSGAVDAAGTPIYRTGTSMAGAVTLKECDGCPTSSWGWQDTARIGVGPAIWFESTGTQTIRIQTREDGVSIDQIVISGNAYLNRAPGSSTNDTTVLSAVP